MRETPTGRAIRCGSRAAAAAFLLCAFLLPATSAQAVDDNVRRNCAGDYLAYCSMHPVGSQALRGCMRANGSKLTMRCVDALADSGEISRTDQAKRRSLVRSGSRTD
jgi:hypothetical protein